MPAPYRRRFGAEDYWFFAGALAPQRSKARGAISAGEVGLTAAGT